MKREELLIETINIIREGLFPLINHDYVYLDLPYHSNIGDTLIWKGIETFLASLSYKCLFRSSNETFENISIPSDVIILLHGGGNFGDLYAPHSELRRRVVLSYPNNKIIILPQTVYYEGARNARLDAKIFRQHKHLTICARDQYSYRFLKAFGFSKNILLIPDMAFCINREELMQYSRPSLNKDLFFKRVDREKSDGIDISYLPDIYDTSDWPNYETSEPMVEHLYELINNRQFKEADEYAVSTYLPQRVITGVEHISQYNQVFSNRLHGAILSILLGKDVYILDNFYGKNSQYYKTWLKDFENVHLLSESYSFNLKRKLRFFIHWSISCVERLL